MDQETKDRQPVPPNGTDNAAPAPRPRLQRRARIALAIVATALILASAVFWWYSSHWASTDDAQVDGHLNPISARVSGHVIRVNVEDNQFVKAGTVLVEIDPTDYRVARDRARADYATAAAEATAALAAVPITAVSSAGRLATAGAQVDNARAGVTAAEKRLAAAEAQLREAEAKDARAQADLTRYRPLVSRDVISHQQFDQTLAAAKSAAAAVDAARATANVARQEVTQAGDRLAQARAELRTAQTAPQQVTVSRSRATAAVATAQRAKAALEQAELNLRYTTITAPVDGIVGRKSAEVGQNVEPGQVLLVLVPTDDIWVTANFKENQLRRLRPGQRVRISVDAYDRTYDGFVESIGGASGARFSLFPPENATGNYVKVVQRIPVRIRFARGQDREHLLRPGMSVVPKVRVR
ncbi:RND transporter [Geotalea uraniireducens]|uniref:RND transporter n=1 Tax=Geotalea uraniireducens TaxID=351604 RepID=A0ABM8EPP2_9BACT|nr:HlyD family secretion protein [Geotalea uraniireducens]BDV44013.1 RND transporter [Geotalea uraniireducens]